MNTVWGNTCCYILEQVISRKRATSQKLCPTKKLNQMYFFREERQNHLEEKQPSLPKKKNGGSCHLFCTLPTLFSVKFEFYVQCGYSFSDSYYHFEKKIHSIKSFHLVWHNSMFAFNAKTSAMTLFKTRSAWLLKIKRGILYVDFFFTNFSPNSKDCKIVSCMVNLNGKQIMIMKLNYVLL